MIEGMLLKGCPVPREVFLGQINERMGKGGVIGNKAMLEVGKS